LEKGGRKDARFEYTESLSVRREQDRGEPREEEAHRLREQ